MVSPVLSPTEKVSPVFVGKFCQEMEDLGEAVLKDVASAFNLAEQLKIFRSGFEGSYCTTTELAKWLLETWVSSESEIDGAEKLV